MIIYLDLGKVNLYGWEHGKDLKTVERYAEAAARGADFPPVFVKKIDEQNYELTPHRELDNCGGHHRAIAHCLAGRPLKCVVVESASEMPENYRYLIQNAKLIDIDFS